MHATCRIGSMRHVELGVGVEGVSEESYRASGESYAVHLSNGSFPAGKLPSERWAELDACDVSNWMYATCRIGCGKLTASMRKVIGPVGKVMPFTSQMAVSRPENCHLRGGRNWMHATCRIGCMRHVELGVGS